MSNALPSNLYKIFQNLIQDLEKAHDEGDVQLESYLEDQLSEFAKTNNIDRTKPVTEDTSPPPPDDPGYVKPGGWGANADATTWKVVSMKDTPSEFKIVDDKNVNVVVHFKTQVGAQAYIDKAKGGNGPPPPPPPPPSGDLDVNGQLKIFPDKQGGKTITDHTVRYFTRHYRSDKPDEPTVEMHIDSGSPAINSQECTAVVEMTGMSHPDSIDWKLLGGNHSSSTPKTGTCYDLEVMTDGSPSKTLEVESPHPDNHPAHQKALFSPGDLSKKTFGWKGIAIQTKDGKGVHIESWINLTPADQTKWQKYIEVDDTGQLYKGTSPILKPYGTLAIVRIDGIEGKPLFTKVSMREIAWPT